MGVIVKMGTLINRFDTYILLFIKKYFHNKYLDILMPIITCLGNVGIIWILLAVYLLLDKPYRMVGAIVLITLIVGTAFGEGIVKHLVRRSRPCYGENNTNLLISKPITYSFPSGHTLSSFAAAEILSSYFIQYKYIFFILAILIALSRLYLYVHYPTDVIAGIVFGLLCSKLVIFMLNKELLNGLLVFLKL